VKRDDRDPKPTLGMHKDLILDLAKLDRSVLRAVGDVFEKFGEHTHAGIHLERINNARDPRLRTIRITDFWRGVVVAEEGNTYLLIRVLPHDDAIHFAKTRRASVNRTAGFLEIRNDVVLEQVTPGLQEQAAKSEQRLFAHVSDGDFRHLGIDDDILATARLLTELDQIDRLRSSLPPGQLEVLENLALGMSVEDAWQALTDGEVFQVDPGDLTTAMARSSGSVLLVEGAEELRDFLEGPMAAWRIFLHPTQRRIAYRRSYSGPAKVTGGAGTGKTVVALHRAYHLAVGPEVGEGGILLTTYTKNLAAALSAQADLLMDDEARGKVRVVNVDKLAYEIVAEAAGKAPSVAADRKSVVARWKMAGLDPKLDFSDEFMNTEYEEVVLAQGIKTREEYLAAKRHGRSVALGTRQREDVWAGIQAYLRHLKQDPRRSFLEIACEAADILNARPGKPFRNVIVDEAQDLHPVQWRMLRAAVAPGRDDLFITGDAHQRIYGNRVSLGSLGIPTAGRSATLRICYRTTQEILGYALRLLGDESADDLDGNADVNLAFRSPMHGHRPKVLKTSTFEEEQTKLVEQVREWIGEGVAAEDIAIAARTKDLATSVQIALVQAGFAARRLVPDGDDAPGVRVGTMHAMKGLEFRCVALASVNADEIPAAWAITPLHKDPAAHDNDMHAERCLLYVAGSRARERLVVSWHGTPSPFLG
jgi:superfamily I DNA/RNA helicase